MDELRQMKYKVKPRLAQQVMPRMPQGDVDGGREHLNVTSNLRFNSCGDTHPAGVGSCTQKA